MSGKVLGTVMGVVISLAVAMFIGLYMLGLSGQGHTENALPAYYDYSTVDTAYYNNPDSYIESDGYYPDDGLGEAPLQ